MVKIAFDKGTRESLARLLVRRLREDFDLEIAPMDGQRLLDVLAESLGPAFYNQGLADAQAAVQARVHDIAEGIAGLEQPEPR